MPQLSSTFNVTFVCSGNICRSPMAEVIAADAVRRAGLASSVTIDSAGLGDWHVGQPADPRAVTVLESYGYDGSAHRARVFEPAEFLTTHLLVALAEEHADTLATYSTGSTTTEIRLLRSFGHDATDAHSVPDPYYGGVEDFEIAYTQIAAAIPHLVGHLHMRLATTPQTVVVD